MDNTRQVLEQHGYVWKEFKTDNPPTKRKYYTPDGRELILPADALSLSTYLSKGFTLTPPVKQPDKEVAVVVNTVNEPETMPGLKCADCGYDAKDHVGLAIHRRKAHNPKKYHKKSTRRTIEPVG